MYTRMCGIKKKNRAFLFIIFFVNDTFKKKKKRNTTENSFCVQDKTCSRSRKLQAVNVPLSHHCCANTRDSFLRSTEFSLDEWGDLFVRNFVGNDRRNETIVERWPRRHGVHLVSKNPRDQFVYKKISIVVIRVERCCDVGNCHVQIERASVCFKARKSAQTNFSHTGFS